MLSWRLLATKCSTLHFQIYKILIIITRVRDKYDTTEGGDALLLADPWPQLRCPSPLPTVISCDETEEQSQHSQEALPHEDDGGGTEVLPPTALRTAGNQLTQVTCLKRICSALRARMFISQPKRIRIREKVHDVRNDAPLTPDIRCWKVIICRHGFYLAIAVDFIIDIEEVPVSEAGGGDAVEPAVTDDKLDRCRRPREMAVVASPARKRSLQWWRRPQPPKDAGAAEKTVAASGDDGEQARRPRAGMSFSATFCSK